MGRSDDDMYRDVEWLVPSDRVILAEFRGIGEDRWVKPGTLRLNVSLSHRHIQERCRELAERGLLDRHDETPAYRLTDLGIDFLDGNLAAEDLRNL